MIFYFHALHLHPNFILMEISKEEHILIVAEEIFAQKGFSGTSTREICKEAEVNISMISYYFGSKEKLYERIFEYRMKESQSFAKEIMDQPGVDEWQKMSNLVDQFMSRIIKLKSFYKIVQREQLRNNNCYIVEFLKTSKMSFLNFYKELFESGYKNGVFTKKPKLEFVHSTIAGSLFAGINGKDMYKEFFGQQDHADFDEKYYNGLKENLKNILKYLLGYHEK